MQDLVSGYGQTEVLHGITVGVEEGSAPFIIGPNGAGKTTLLKTIMGLLKPTRGRILLRNGDQTEDITDMKPHQAVSKGICMVPEGRRIFQKMTVLENLKLAAYTVNDTGAIRQNMKKVFEIFPILRERINQRAGTLSGGEQSMLAIGRAMMLEPRIILLDEPSLGLAPKLISDVYGKLKEIKEKGVTLLIVEQNVEKALSMAEHVYVLNSGQVVFSGDPGSIKREELLGKYYSSKHSI